ncbi:hypothetical protein [Lichenifustis flavocetrariae]|uniref:Cysteine rich repeat-containing protein n=1 Tax=Lichenifustis flavocetrariae TaxID=2949735 RepID=A0AA41YX51_9HYPH|nr:hypothetical protein [Lichenifustis flavocetrariae]MCW6508623.1 hypothetical protein [Lichenifustis flavocetrariae]
MRVFFLSAVLVSLFGNVASAETVSNGALSLEERQQAACYNDAQRLCGDAFPDVDQVRSCMGNKKKLVSAACAAFYPK